MRTKADSSPRTRGRVALIASIVAAVLSGVGLAVVLATPSSVDMLGNAVSADADQIPTPAVVAEMNPMGDTGDRLRVPTVDLDVPLGSLSAVDGQVTPPGFTSAYLIRNYGTDIAHAAEGTVFVVTHSLRGGGVAPGNYLIDIGKGTTRLRDGDTIELGALTYSVTGGSIASKSELAVSSDVWEATPGRLIIITCLQSPSGLPSTKNAIITATLVREG